MAATASNLVPIAAYTVLIYDYLTTLNDEVSYIWSSSWSPALPLFYLNRYIPFIDQSLLLYHYHKRDANAELCKHLLKSGTWLVTMGGNIAYTITYLQTCAIWRRKRCIVIPLLFVLIGKVLVSIVLIHLHLEAIIWYTDPEPVGKCEGIARTKYPRYIYLSVFISETFTIGLTLVKAFEHVRQSGSPWVHQLYKNGILYSVCVLLLSILNAVMPFVSPLHSGIFVRPQRVMESVLCSRIVFVILKQQRRRYSTSFHDDNFYYYNGGGTGSLFSTLSGPRDIFTSAFGFVGTGTRTVPATVGLSGPPIADTARRKQGEIVSNRSTRSSVEWEMQVLDHNCGRRED